MAYVWGLLVSPIVVLSVIFLLYLYAVGKLRIWAWGMQKPPQKRTIFIDDNKYFIEFPDMTFYFVFKKTEFGNYKVNWMWIKSKKHMLLLNCKIVKGLFDNYWYRICLGDEGKRAWAKTKQELVKQSIHLFYTTKYNNDDWNSTAEDGEKVPKVILDYYKDWQDYGLDYANENHVGELHVSAQDFAEENG